MAGGQGDGAETVYERIYHQFEIYDDRQREDHDAIRDLKGAVERCCTDVNRLYEYRRQELEAEKKRAADLEAENKRLREKPPAGGTVALKKESIRSRALVWVQLISTIGAIAIAVIALLSK